MISARKFGEIHDHDGKVLVEIVGPGRSDDALSIGLRIVTQQIRAKQPNTDKGSGLFGGEFGYGANFENDIFLMHRCCWCEKAGECPWCTGCAIYQETKQCQACSEAFPHAVTCYQTEVNQALKEAGLSYIGEEGVGYVYVEPAGLSWEKRRRIEKAIYDDLCSQHGLNREFGYGNHCDCGANNLQRKAIEDRGCDYHFGRGIFARFKPYVLDHERHYYDPPNFWHKATNFRVNWYKYIGRDNALNRDITTAEWRTILGSVLDSLGGPNLDKAVEEFIAAEASRNQ